MKQKTSNVLEAAANKSPVADEGFISTDELLKRLPVSKGTLHNYRKAGKIPFIKISGRVIWSWPLVREALLRQSRGGVQ